MTIFNVFSLFGGLALFLFGMDIMGKALEKQAGGQLQKILSKLTDNPVKGFFLGLCVTAIIQSSSATTVMVVGFVNSGIMELHQAIGVIMGSNVGTTVTSWILSLSGLQGDSLLIQMLKPTSFSPVLAFIGILLYLGKNEKRKGIGTIMIGFAILMTGMTTMSNAVAPLQDEAWFTNLFVRFSNPILGVLVGAIVTGVIQSSSASVGILQALSATGVITYGSAIPIIMGQNIGTCVTALLSSVGAAGVQNDQRLLGKDPDAAAVLDGRKALQNGLIGDLKAFAPERERHFDGNGRIACRVAAQERQRDRVSAVIHLAGKLLGFQECDVLGVRHHQLTIALAGSHDELTEDCFGLLRRGDADRTLPHDTGSQRGRALHRAADAVWADGRYRADRHGGQSRCQTGIRQLHHSQLTACRAKTNGGSGQLCSGAGQRLGGRQLFRGLTEKHLVHRSTLHPDAGRKRLTPGMVQARDKTGCLQDGPQQACRGRLACRARHADKLHLLHRSGQGGTQFLRRGKALRQSLKIVICLVWSHSVNPRFDVYRAKRTSGRMPAGTAPPAARPARP